MYEFIDGVVVRDGFAVVGPVSGIRENLIPHTVMRAEGRVIVVPKAKLQDEVQKALDQKRFELIVRDPAALEARAFLVSQWAQHWKRQSELFRLSGSFDGHAATCIRRYQHGLADANKARELHTLVTR